MDLFVGLDVSVRITSVCVMDGAGRAIKEAKVESEASAIAAMLGNFDGHYRRVGVEAGPLSQWLYSGLATAGYPVICVETRHVDRPRCADQQDRQERCARHRPDDAYRPVSAGPCKDRAAQPGDQDAAGGAAVPVVEADRRREQPARVRSAQYPKGRPSLNAAALVWSKAPVIVGAHDTGPLIRSKDGFWLAIAMPEAGKSIRGGRIGPGEWERRTGMRLRFVYRRTGPSCWSPALARRTSRPPAVWQKGKRPVPSQ